MDIDPAQPWGTAIDYAGRATVVEDGHTIHVNVTDTGLSSVIEPDSVTGRYPTVYVTAQFTETGGNNVALRGYGQISVQPTGTEPVTPDPTAIQRAVAAAIADFRANTAAYAALCAAWTTPTPPTDPGEEPATA
ncbi:ATP-binding protein [Streptomyces spinoverrucosus]|uniref:ATP-binding protein n=1 Tax=Streptomyces spinoverrucosus TaxID=284043 RepID=UPI0018C37706|nr:ATP-binding protein [Streptomyces spinoverrucosus]MBG0853223.1 ATP-binding protein [Streptomyces spinoverrucosus]